MYDRNIRRIFLFFFFFLLAINDYNAFFSALAFRLCANNFRTVFIHLAILSAATFMFYSHLTIKREPFNSVSLMEEDDEGSGGGHFSSKARRKRSKTRIRPFRAATLSTTGAELEKNIIPIFFLFIITFFTFIFFFFNSNSKFTVYIVIIVHEDTQTQKHTAMRVVTRTTVSIVVYLRMLVYL